MKGHFYKFFLVFILSISAQAESFFGLEVEKTMSAFKSNNGNKITKCEDRHKFSSEIRLKSEVTGKYDDDERQTPTVQIECSMGESLKAYFIKVQNDMLLWKISKWNLNKSILKVARDLEEKTSSKIKIDAESVNENMGVQYTFKTPLAGGEIRGRAVSPYSKQGPDLVTMADSGEVDLIIVAPLKKILVEQERKEAELKNKEKSKINSGETGI